MGLSALIKRIQAELSSGVTRQELFGRLLAEMPGKFSMVAFAIASVPTEARRKKLLYHNAFLTLLLIACSVVSLLVELPIDMNKPTFFIGLKVVIPMIGAYFTFHFFGGVYRPLVAWCFVDLAEAVLLFDPASLAEVAHVLLLLVIIPLALFIGLRGFPHLRMIGVKKDKEGLFQLQ